MRYDEIDLSTIEREAYVTGDARLAAIAALALDAEAEQDRADGLDSVIYGIRERITESNWRTGKKAELRELIENIIAELNEAPK